MIIFNDFLKVRNSAASQFFLKVRNSATSQKSEMWNVKARYGPESKNCHNSIRPTLYIDKVVVIRTSLSIG